MINVRNIVNAEVERAFIQKKPTDRSAAALRLTATEQMLEDWYFAINATNTRDLPADLEALYEDAARTIIRICSCERMIVTGEEERQ